MTTAVHEVRDSLVQLWGSLGTFWGVSPTTARVFGWLYSQRSPADAEEIMEGLQLSRGAVSMACRDLREWGLVFAEKASGSRRIVYRPETDLERVVRHVVETRKRRELDPILEHLRDWIPQLETDEGDDAELLVERLKAMEALIGLADSVAGVVLKGGTVTNFGLKLLVRSARGDERQMEMSDAGEPRT